MDVHKNTYSLCGINSSTGEIIAQTKCATKVKKTFLNLLSQLKKECMKKMRWIFYLIGWC